MANAITERAAARGQSLDRRVAGRSILDRSSICERHRPAPGPRERNDHQEVVCRPTSRGRSDEPEAAVDRDHFREVARPRSEGSNGWPFAGRERELAAIVRGARGGAAAVVLAGPTGVGKSRLAARGPAELGRYGWSTDTVRGTSSARDTPHRALAHLLPAVMPADVINPLRWAVDQMVPAGQRRRALLVDDAHQLDAASSGRGEPSGRATPGNGARLRQNRRTHPRCDRLAVAGGPRRTDRAGSAVRRGNRTYRAGRVEGCDRARDARTPCSGADLLFRGRRIAWPLP